MTRAAPAPKMEHLELLLSAPKVTTWACSHQPKPLCHPPPPPSLSVSGTVRVEGVFEDNLSSVSAAEEVRDQTVEQRTETQTMYRLFSAACVCACVVCSPKQSGSLNTMLPPPMLNRLLHTLLCIIFPHIYPHTFISTFYLKWLIGQCAAVL